MDCGTPQVSSQRKVQYTHHFDHGRHFFDDLGAVKFTDSITNTIPNHTYPKKTDDVCVISPCCSAVHTDKIVSTRDAKGYVSIVFGTAAIVRDPGSTPRMPGTPKFKLV